MMHTPFLLLVCGLMCVSCHGNLKSAPNVLFILTDDQDVELGGQSPVVKARKLIGDAGAVFSNMFVTTPLCCPSRSSILTGRYIHNIGVHNNSVNGGCSSPNFQKGPEKQAFPTYLKKQKYTTFFAGKYLNQYGFKKTGGPQHVPPGWDYWNGLVGNSRYYNYTLSVNGKSEPHGDQYEKDYLTHIIHNRAKEFLQKEATEQPFFMMLSTPACHAPFTPAPQYSANFSRLHAPRDGSFNKYGQDKHWIVRRANNPMSETSVKYIDEAFRNRWRTLLSVDDMVEDLIGILEKKNLLDNTYVFFSSDNGFHLGQFSLPNDKRHMYEFDIRVPLMVRGPGIKAGQLRQEMILNIDFAPTFIELTGGNAPSDMDGKSFKSLLHSKESQPWRDRFLVEYRGEHHNANKGCPDTNGLANCFPDCVCEDAVNNTYNCLRGMQKGTDDYMFCVFYDSEKFVEFYDLVSDPHQLENKAGEISPADYVTFTKSLQELSVCHGSSCK